ncbi:MAG: T9SS type A sorting domain-containing protein [Bacteroidales bacterium]|nr:T9SS type A sorting domain-containing protein [Bacteroidales bacterium]MCF8386909.1 T9SS type A sorting domain-containing protein [Bacteroidales bacterium]MCF8396992.1 T9SS type A sorting domain-containing protein [Bacteroidales bacterium]
MDGKIISQHSCEGGNNRLFLSHIPPGVYILAIKTPGNNYATKIIKNSSNDY